MAQTILMDSSYSHTKASSESAVYKYTTDDFEPFGTTTPNTEESSLSIETQFRLSDKLFNLNNVRTTVKSRVVEDRPRHANNDGHRRVSNTTQPKEMANVENESQTHVKTSSAFFKTLLRTASLTRNSVVTSAKDSGTTSAYVVKDTRRASRYVKSGARRIESRVKLTTQMPITHIPNSMLPNLVAHELDCSSNVLNRVNTTMTALSVITLPPIEGIILVSFFALWIFAIILFIRKWHHLKLIEPREHTLRQKPKNLDSVKIVKRSSDSVIYQAYPIAMTRTMALREKRLERMHTMPAIKLDPEEKSPAKTLKALAMKLPGSYVRTLNDDTKNDERCSSPKEHHPMLVFKDKH